MDYETCYDYRHEMEIINKQLHVKTKGPKGTYVLNTLKQFRLYGWRKSYLRQTFKYLTRDSMCEMASWIFIQEWFKYTADTRGCLYDGSFIDRLYSLGLRHKVAKRIAFKCEPLQDVYTIPQLIEIAFKIMTDHYKPFRYTTKFRYNPTIIDQWIPTEIPHINLNTDCSVEPGHNSNMIYYVKSLKKFSPQMIGEFTKMFYHVTSWDECDRITNGYIELHDSYYPTYSDFQQGPALYMYENIDDALELGHKLKRLYSSELSIIIFALPSTPPASLNFKHLQGDEWMTRTKNTRYQYKDNKYFQAHKRDFVDFIYGQAVANIKQLYEEYEAEPTPHIRPKYQLAATSEAGCQYLTSRIAGVLYFKKGRT